MITFCDDKYKLLKRVGHGSFGAVFLTAKVGPGGLNESMVSMDMTQNHAQSSNINPGSFMFQNNNNIHNVSSNDYGINNNNTNNHNNNAASAAPAQHLNTLPQNQNQQQEQHPALPGMITPIDDGVSQNQNPQQQLPPKSSSTPSPSSTPNNNNNNNNNPGAAVSIPHLPPFPIPPSSNNNNHNNSSTINNRTTPHHTNIQIQAAQTNISSNSISQQHQQNFQQHYITKLEQLPRGATASNPGDASRSHLTREYRFYKYMHDCCENLLGIPQVYDFGVEGQYRFLVMDQCGPSLDALFRAKSKNFTPLTILRIAQQMISRIEFVHTLGLVHRDIKPENWCMGMHEKCHVVFLIDFGLSKMFRSKKNGDHVAIVTGKRLAGTARYASIWTHEGISQARRDDMEGIWYTLLYLARGGFPWDTGPSTANVEEYIGSVKKKVPPEQLCKNVPEPLKTFMMWFITHVRTLGFDQEPDYFQLRQQCIAALHQLGRSETLECVADYCWFKPPPADSDDETNRNRNRKNHKNADGTYNNNNSQGGESTSSNGRLGGGGVSSYANNIDSSFASAQSQVLGMGAQSSRGLGGWLSQQSGGAQSPLFGQNPASLFSPQEQRLPPPHFDQRTPSSSSQRSQSSRAATPGSPVVWSRQQSENMFVLEGGAMNNNNNNNNAGK